MGRFFLRRVVQGATVIVTVASICFLLIHLAPGDPFASVLDDPRVTEDVRAAWRAQAGLDRPLGEQYVRYLTSLARGELGYSYIHQRPVAAVLREALPNTLLLMGTALVVSFGAGIALGVLQAARRGSAGDRVLGSGSLVIASLPEFWLALVLLLCFAYWVPIFPAGGLVDPVMHDYLTPGAQLLDRLRHLILPSATLALLNMATVARHQRSALLQVLPEDFVRTARAKGLPERRVVLRHALRNALVPVITLLGLAAPALVTGAVFVEGVFSWPGMGSVAIRALAARDHHLVLATVILGSVLVVAGGLLADVLLVRADPRLRASS